MYDFCDEELGLSSGAVTHLFKTSSATSIVKVSDFKLSSSYSDVVHLALLL